MSRHARADRSRRTRRRLVELAIQIAEKILQTTLAAEPERVADVLRGALRKAYVRDRLQVVCNPDDLGADRAAPRARCRRRSATLKDLELIGDRRVQRGGVVVRTPGGDIDATIGSQLERLRAACSARTRRRLTPRRLDRRRSYLERAPRAPTRTARWAASPR